MRLAMRGVEKQLESRSILEGELVGCGECHPVSDNSFLHV